MPAVVFISPCKQPPKVQSRFDTFSPWSVFRRAAPPPSFSPALSRRLLILLGIVSSNVYDRWFSLVYHCPLPITAVSCYAITNCSTLVSLCFHFQRTGLACHSRACCRIVFRHSCCCWGLLALLPSSLASLQSSSRHGCSPKYTVLGAAMALHPRDGSFFSLWSCSAISFTVVSSSLTLEVH